ncbi:Helothermine [Arthrobotrys entomopaga]|nr:Helothermine [Arthrobotrys entomopaga]
MQILNLIYATLYFGLVTGFPVAEPNKNSGTLASSRVAISPSGVESGPENLDTDASPFAWQQSVLNYHNGWRAHHQVGALAWSNTLAAAALKSASKCQFQLTPNNIYGENIAAGTYTNPDWYAYMWYNGSLKYDYNKPGFSYETGTFTQVVWKDSTQLGCAYVQNCPGGYPNMMFCEYAPPGNIIPDSNFATEVLPPVANPPNPSPPPMMSNGL